MQQRQTHARWRQILAAAAVFLSAASAVGLRAGPPSQIPMTAEFRDDVSLPDRIMSDGLGPYVHGVGQVKAILDGRGDFDLDTNASGKPALRLLSLDFTVPASCPASGCQPPFATGSEDAYMSTGAGGLPNMAIGASTRSKLQVSFSSGGNLQWFVRFDPSQYPDTSSVLVTRLDVNSWTIEAGATDTAKLLSAPTSGKLVLTDRGNYFLPFRVVIRRK